MNLNYKFFLVIILSTSTTAISSELDDVTKRKLIDAGYLMENLSVKMSDLNVGALKDNLVYLDKSKDYMTSFEFSVGIDWQIFYKITSNKEMLDKIKSSGEFKIYDELFIFSQPKWWDCKPGQNKLVSNSLNIKGDYKYVVLDYDNNTVYQYSGTN